MALGLAALPVTSTSEEWYDCILIYINVDDMHYYGTQVTKNFAKLKNILLYSKYVYKISMK